MLTGLQIFKVFWPSGAIATGAGSYKIRSEWLLSERLSLWVCKLPSTSPANASWSFERKLAAWREVFEKHGLI